MPACLHKSGPFPAIITMRPAAMSILMRTSRHAQACPFRLASPQPVLRFTSLTGELSYGLRLRCLAQAAAMSHSVCRRQSGKFGCHESHGHEESSVAQTKLGFWSSKPIWKRASINTFRCLIGCSLGDFSALWYLQAYHPNLGIGTIMAISSK